MARPDTSLCALPVSAASSEPRPPRWAASSSRRIVQPATTVSDQRWSYPWSSGALVPVSILWASLHVLVFVGLLGFARSGVAGHPRSARLGTTLTLVGTALLFVGEIASILIRDQRTDDTGAVIVGAIFALAILLTAVGFLAAGIATVRAGSGRAGAASRR